MRIFRINEDRLPHVIVSGRTLRGVQDYFLQNIEEVDSLYDVPRDVEGYYCVIYNDTPLLTQTYLETLAEECDALKTCYLIGDGYITKKNYDGSYKKCDNPLAFQVKDYSDISNISTYLKNFVMSKLFNKNVVIYDPVTTFIDLDVEIEEGAIIHPMVTLAGKTIIRKKAVIFSGCELIDTDVGENVDIRATYALEAKIGNHTTVGPYACLRKKAVIGAYCRVGDFVEVKNSNIADGVKMAHLAYVGDSDVEKTPMWDAERCLLTITERQNSAVKWAVMYLLEQIPIWLRQLRWIMERTLQQVYNNKRCTRWQPLYCPFTAGVQRKLGEKIKLTME